MRKCCVTWTSIQYIHTRKWNPSEATEKLVVLATSSCLDSLQLSVCPFHESTKVVQKVDNKSLSGRRDLALEMGFGEDLRCPQAHSAVMRLLDSELHLMEVMKKWMGQRAKSEREFSVQMHHMAAMVERLDRAQPSTGQDYISQLNKVSYSEVDHQLSCSCCSMSMKTSISTSIFLMYTIYSSGLLKYIFPHFSI